AWEFSGDKAVVWLQSKTTEFQGRVRVDYSTIVYMTGKISVKQLQGGKSTDLSQTMVENGQGQVVRFAVRGEVFVTADDKTLLLGLTGGDSVQVFDVSAAVPKLIKTIKTGNGAHAFRAAGDKRHVFVSNRVANSISKVDLQTLAVVDTYNVPGGPDCMDVSADGKFLLVTARWIKKLTVIDIETKKITKQVNVGRSPHGVWTLEHAPR
ncbi:MAG: hypothetical protein RL171_1420, partial [Pseudomonadota bacterium]